MRFICVHKMIKVWFLIVNNDTVNNNLHLKHEKFKPICGIFEYFDFIFTYRFSIRRKINYEQIITYLFPMKPIGAVNNFRSNNFWSLLFIAFTIINYFSHYKYLF